MTSSRIYKYAGNTECGCCDNPCPSIVIDENNFNEYCNTSGEEWLVNNYGTTDYPDKQCELWYRQSAAITLDRTKTGAVDKSVWIDGFAANAWDAKYNESGQTRADGDTFVITETITLGSHTIVYSDATEWTYNTDTGMYDKTRKIGIHIDGNQYWTDELEYSGDTSSDSSYAFNVVIYRNGNKVDVYTNNGGIWVWSFTDSTQNTFTYAFQAVYTGSTKYILVTPLLTWKTVKYKPDAGCVYYPPGALTQNQINDIEERQRLSYENNPACEYATGTLCPVFSPPFGFFVANKPTDYSDCPSTYGIVYIATSIYGTSYSFPIWDIQKTSFCITSGVARRINLAVEYISVITATNHCSELPYGYTIDYYLYAADAAAVTITTSPESGMAIVVDELDGNNEVYIRRIRYTAPSSMPAGKCIDWLEYQITGLYGETSRGVLKFKLYQPTETQSYISEEYLGGGTKSVYYQNVLKLTIEGERANVGDTTTETHWHVELYGLLPHIIKDYNDLSGVTFTYIDGISYWNYQTANVGNMNDSVSSDIPLTPQDTLYQEYIDAKAMLESITAQITLLVSTRGANFIVSNNNIIDSCSTQQIESTTTAVSVKLVKSRVYTVETGNNRTTTRTELDSQQLSTQTLVLDWGLSPAESASGLTVPTDQSLPAIDVSQYYSRFNVSSVPLSVRIRIGQIDTKTTPESGVLWTGNDQYGTTPNNESWQSYDEVKAEIQTTTSITYF